jgi:predicted AlkP superfamily pyrophosphatase or phosphodiesterase
MTHRRTRRIVLLLVALVATVTLAARQAPAAILILISFDGWRWDYTDRFDVPNLKALAARGVRSDGLIPSYPTLTFPNHYTIVTGLWPDHHGVVGNSMVDPTIGPDKFTMSSATARDPRWWGGEPIWITARRQGRKSASMFWPGSEAVHPTYWKPFDDNLPNDDRVNQVLDWLKLPDTDRPSFITLYFSDVDSAGHSGGPNSTQVLDAAKRLDAQLGTLVGGIERLGLLNRTTLIVVSDHGMAETSSERRVYLDDYVSLDDVVTVESGAALAVNPRGTLTVDALYQKLAGRHPALKIYRRGDVPSRLHYGTHARVPAIVGLVQSGWTVSTRASAARSTRSNGGAHGYDPAARDMHGLLVAAGPELRRGFRVPELPNVHLYALMCRILQLTPARNDGDPVQTASFFKQ